MQIWDIEYRIHFTSNPSCLVALTLVAFLPVFLIAICKSLVFININKCEAPRFDIYASESYRLSFITYYLHSLFTIPFAEIALGGKPGAAYKNRTCIITLEE